MKTLILKENQSIQKAIDEIEKEGGGEIIFLPGVYQTGPIDLCSNLILTLMKGSTIKFDENPTGYSPVWTRWEGVECFAMHPLIFSNCKHNIILRGEGLIDGSGEAWWQRFKEIELENRNVPKYSYELELANLNPDYSSRVGGGGRPQTQFLRPSFIQFYKSTNIKMEGVTIENSPFWTIHTVFSKEIFMEDIKVFNPSDAINTDAIDIDSCNQVTIKGCELDVGDDAVTLKSGSGFDGLRVNKPTENILIQNCKIFSSHGGVAIGSETAGGVKNVQVENCEFKGTQRAIRIKSRRGRGGEINNIKFQNLVMDGCWCPIVISTYFSPGLKNDEKERILNVDRSEVTVTTPVIKDIQVKNITASNILSTAGFVVGLPESPIENLIIENYLWELAPRSKRINTTNTEYTDGLFHNSFRGVKIINTINTKLIKTKIDI